MQFYPFFLQFVQKTWLRFLCINIYREKIVHGILFLMEHTFEKSVERFRTALKIDTAWPEALKDSDNPGPEQQKAEKALVSFQDFLVKAYPAFHKKAERIVLSPYSVLYHWKGTGADKNIQHKPVLFLAHYDVVPVDEEHWSEAPFGAVLKDEYIYARGSLDTKITLISAMEAAEKLTLDGFNPERDIWFAFGGDEERSGLKGAHRAAAWFKEQGISFAWTLDEGSIIADGLLPGVSKPLALVAVEEKGFMDIELIVKQSPGHASRPPAEQAAAILARALCRIEKKPFPYKLTPAAEGFFKGIAEFSPPLKRFVLTHARALGKLFFKLASTTPETEALLHTTVAMTQLFGSKADNILPAETRAILNLRLLDPWDIESAVEYIRTVVKDDRVLVRCNPDRAANGPIAAKKGCSDESNPSWKLLSDTIRAVFPDAAVLPFLNTATTDSRFYADLCDAVYRIGPIRLNAGELSRVHGHDERISLENVRSSIDFYTRFAGAL